MSKNESRVFHLLTRVFPLVAALPILAACSEDTQKPDNPPLPVLVETISLSDYAPRVHLTGEIQARAESNLSFLIAGKIVERSVGVGDSVRAGQVIARVDASEKQADVRAAEASVTASEAVLRQASANFERLQSLLERKVATRKDFDAAQESLQTAQSALDVSTTQLETARETLAYTTLKAPRDGIVTASSVEVGQVAQAGQTIYTIAEDGPRDAVFYVDEGAFATGDPSSTITVFLLSDPSTRVEAVIHEISPTVDTKTGTIRVKVELKEPPPGMALGSAVVGEASLKARRVMSLPAGALSSLDGKPAVWTFDPGTSQVKLRPIIIQAYASDRILVESGLSVGDIVVTRGGQLLHPGQTVKAMDGSAT